MELTLGIWVNEGLTGVPSMVRAYAGPPVLLAGAAALDVAPSQRRLNQRNGD
jgi:hypothetical protein